MVIPALSFKVTPSPQFLRIWPTALPGENSKIPVPKTERNRSMERLLLARESLRRWPTGELADEQTMVTQVTDSLPFCPHNDTHNGQTFTTITRSGLDRRALGMDRQPTLESVSWHKLSGSSWGAGRSFTCQT